MFGKKSKKINWKKLTAKFEADFNDALYKCILTACAEAAIVSTAKGVKSVFTKFRRVDSSKIETPAVEPEKVATAEAAAQA